MTGRVVVVGGGLAATRCVDELRRRRPESAVVLLSDEALPPYDRPPLTKAYLRDGGAPPSLRADWTDVDLRLGAAAVGLDLDRGEVAVRGGAPVGFDDLVIATGARPRTLPGLDGPGTHTVRTAGDADALRADLLEHRQVVVVGGGFIGCEVATTARALGVAVVLIEALATPLARVLGEVVGGHVTGLHRAQGVEVFAGAAVVAVHGTAGARVLELSTGVRVPAPVAVVGLGVAPETGWLTGCGLRLDDGVLCDVTGRSSHDHVWAAGDVARWATPTGEAVRSQHWTASGRQGQLVAAALAGEPQPFDEVPYVWSDQAGVTMQLLGTPQPGDEVTLIDGGSPGAIVALYGRQGVLTAAFGVGAPRLVLRQRAGITAGADYAGAVAAAGVTASR